MNFQVPQMKFCLSTLPYRTHTAARQRYGGDRGRSETERVSNANQRCPPEGESAKVKALTGRYSNQWPFQ